MAYSIKFKISSLIYFTYIVLLSQSAFAVEPAFEAYYKFILGGEHTGYVIQRFVVEDAKKQMTSTYYAYVKTPSGSTTESLVAKADMAFEPISFQYSALVDGKAKSVDATFKNKKMTAKMMTDGKSQIVTLTVPRNGFLSTFLNYVMLKNGLTIGRNYEFYALTEESPACFKGDANCVPKDNGFIKGNAAIKFQQKYKDLDSFRVDINFKSISFVGVLSATGETLGTISPLQDALTEIVATKDEAVAQLPFKESHIRALFGDIPLGKKNTYTAIRTAPTPKKGP